MNKLLLKPESSKKRSAFKTEEFDPAITALRNYRTKLRQLRDPNQTDEELQKNYKEGKRFIPIKSG